MCACASLGSFEGGAAIKAREIDLGSDARETRVDRCRPGVDEGGAGHPQLGPEMWPDSKPMRDRR